MRYGLIGEKLGHSFSKEIHEQIADYTYDLIPLSKDEFHEFMKEKAFTAINVTIPYKKDVIPYLDELDPAAKAIGAVNTIVNRNGSLYGYNTDYAGFRYMVKQHQIAMKGKKVLVIGNGGASAAIQAVVQDEGAAQIVVVSRSANHGAISYEQCYKQHTDAAIIINTSPVGMYPNIDEAPISVECFPACEAILDVIYNPLLTRLCLDGIQHGIKSIAGLEMLVAQAKVAVEYFLDQPVEDQLIDDIYHQLWQRQENLILIGMPSAGKTTIGKALAQQLDKEFIDMDDEIIKLAGKSIPDIFEEIQEEGFRALESEVAAQLAKRGNLVIATGGGVIKRSSNMELLKLNGRIFFLDRAVAQLVSDDENRPLSKNKEALAQMYEERLPLYHTYADHIIDNSNTLEQSIQAIIDTYQKG